MQIPFDFIQSYRARTFRLLPELRLTSKEDAVAHVNQRGFVFFWPITGILLPSLWAAVAGDRPVADEHDDPGHITWGWKDALLGSHAWYYAKILRKKATMISFDLAPYFYALSENYGSYEDDYLTLYEQGRLTMEARQVYEALLDKGPLDTIELRIATRMSAPASEGRFNKALLDLQADFKILPIGVTQSGAWHYAFAYDIVARHYPELPDRAHSVSEGQARQRLAEVYMRSLGAARRTDLGKLFGWKPAETGRVVDALVKSGFLHPGVEIENQPGEWLVCNELTGL
jgi:hypothetical protein